MSETCLSDLLREKEEVIIKLKKSLNEKDEDLVKAGELGSGLLEQNHVLEEMLNDIQKNHLKDFETNEQEKYSLEKKLEVMTKMKAQAESMLEEETLRWKCQLFQVEEKLNRKWGDETSTLKQQIKDISSQLQLEKATGSDRLQTMDMMKEQIQMLQEEFRQKRASVSDTLSMEMAELYNENCDLKLSLQQLELNEQEHSQMVQHLKDMLESTNKSVEGLRQAKEYAERKCSNYCESLENCRDERRALQVEMDLLKFQPNDLNSRGNSLFAEVEDKRIQAEKSLVSMKSKYKCLQAQNEQLKHYVIKLKMQISTLLQTRSRTSDQQYVRSLEESLSMARGDNEKLTWKIQALQKKLQHALDQHLLPEQVDAGDDSAVLQFFKYELKEKTSEIEHLTEDLRLTKLYLMSEEKRASSLEGELHQQRKQLDVAKSAKFKLEVEIDRLKMKCGEDMKTKPYKHKWKSEKLVKDAPVCEEAVRPQITKDSEGNKTPEKENTSATKEEISGCHDSQARKQDEAGVPQEGHIAPLEPNVPSSQASFVEAYNVSAVVKKPADPIVFASEKNGETKMNRQDILRQSDPSKIQKFDRNRVTTKADCKQQ